ncbi:hypothetical protein AGMMS49928_25350 [Spirochaetia bacterium]|nr:hypothetical protein AGMMS49928_25310 [Spirochaetia bacterium]GHV71797.1 hypothetical protein AGMMS49928_25350 [Spirochaetia bacterium]
MSTPWINSYKDIQSEFDVSVVEAFKLWNTPNLKLLETGDIKLLGFDEKKSA